MKTKNFLGEGQKLLSLALAIAMIVCFAPITAMQVKAEGENYLTFTAEEAGSVTFNYLSGTDVKYLTDGGTDWTDYSKGTKINLNAGEKVSFKGTNVKTNSGNHFTMTGKIAASGDVTSLTNGSGGDATLSDDCYNSMFRECTSLTKAPKLPAQTMQQDCYSYMFNGCTSLTTAPNLPATTLASSCYSYMFNGCTSLTQAPNLPATTLAAYCYNYMFNGCTSLTQAPNLPATTLAEYCYSEMFYRCTSLTTAPELPATTLASSCYGSMFYGCTSLTAVPALPASNLASSCYASMFQNCTGLSIKYVQDEEYQIEWNIPATGGADYWNKDMFYGCNNVYFNGLGSKEPELNTTYYQKGTIPTPPNTPVTTEPTTSNDVVDTPATQQEEAETEVVAYIPAMKTTNVNGAQIEGWPDIEKAIPTLTKDKQQDVNGANKELLHIDVSGFNKTIPASVVKVTDKATTIGGLHIFIGNSDALTFLSKNDLSGYKETNFDHKDTITEHSRTIEFIQKQPLGVTLMFHTTIPAKSAKVTVYKVDENKNRTRFARTVSNDKGQVCFPITETATYVLEY